MKVVCESCGSSFPFNIAKDFTECPVCHASFDVDSDVVPTPEKEKNTYYYYKEGGGGLTDTLSSQFIPLYTFEAVDMKDAERQLKEVMPNSPLLRDNSSPETRCPYCRSKEIQLVPKKFGLFTGFGTNRFDRVCVHCKRRF